MTRINVIDPCELTDEHVRAEYREIHRIFGAVERYIAKGTRPKLYPPAYTMGPGHVSFFCYRTGYVSERQRRIIAECLERGFDIQHREARPPIAGWNRPYTPDDRDREINLVRLREKLALRPNWYKYGGEIVPPDFYGVTP